jgi:hypothetical protein
MKTITLKTGEVAMVDDCDYERVAKLKWYRKVSCSGSIYAIANTGVVNGKNGRIYMHRLVMDAPKGFEVDHRFGNTLDNRRENLRILEKGRNPTGFIKKKPGTSSRFRGVFWETQAQTWRARVEHKRPDGSRGIHNVGSFDDETEAAKAYNRAALELGFLPEALNPV